ncbi:MAG: DUF2971 domain-containing protein [Candidatus Scalindua sp.]|nr:DUF2971 domain-containing protein [Candidatus Scalindua sp.]
MSSNQPNKIYRYQRFSATTVESLCHDQLHFADPGAFNDPLDCQPTVESDSDRDTLRLLLTELVRRRIEAEAISSLKSAKLKGKKAAAHAKRLGEQAARSELANIAYHATNPEYEVSTKEAECLLLTNDIQRELQKQYDRGVCCFSAAVGNPLLWSHYGDQHRGLCIGYGLDRVPRPKLQKVVYGGSRTVATSLIAQALLKNDPKAQELLDRDVLLRKASPWRYEREWRLLGNRGVQDSALTLKDVTFGLRCPVALRHSVVTALEARAGEVEFYEMYEVRGSFKLKRSPVDTDEMRAFLPHTAQSGVEIFGPINED